MNAASRDQKRPREPRAVAVRKRKNPKRAKV
jgi:hypothetical protein